MVLAQVGQNGDLHRQAQQFMLVQRLAGYFQNHVVYFGPLGLLKKAIQLSGQRHGAMGPVRLPGAGQLDFRRGEHGRQMTGMLEHLVDITAGGGFAVGAGNGNDLEPSGREPEPGTDSGHPGLTISRFGHRYYPLRDYGSNNLLNT